MFDNLLSEPSRWFYITIKFKDVRDDEEYFEAYEVLEEDADHWNVSSVQRWISRNYSKIINRFTKIEFQFARLEYDPSEE